MYHQFKQLADIDITVEAMEVGPTTHYVMGGVRVDPDSQMSDVPGLFAAGECGAGLHGANRLGGNSLSDLLVFGKRAGQYAAGYARENSLGVIHSDEVAAAEKHALAPFERDGAEGPYAVQHPGWHTAIDLNNLLTVSEMVTRAALERKESRGAHFRDDFPAKDDNFGSCNIVIRKGPGGEMQIRREPIPEMPVELKQIIQEMK